MFHLLNKIEFDVQLLKQTALLMLWLIDCPNYLVVYGVIMS